MNDSIFFSKSLIVTCKDDQTAARAAAWIHSNCPARGMTSDTTVSVRNNETGRIREVPEPRRIDQAAVDEIGDLPGVEDAALIRAIVPDALQDEVAKMMRKDQRKDGLYGWMDSIYENAAALRKDYKQFNGRIRLTEEQAVKLALLYDFRQALSNR